MAVNQSDFSNLRKTFLDRYEKADAVKGHIQSIKTAFDEDIGVGNTDKLDALIQGLISSQPSEAAKKALFTLIDGIDKLNLGSVGSNNGIAIPNGLLSGSARQKLAALALMGCEDGKQYGGHISPRQYYTHYQVYNRLWRYSNDPDHLADLEKAKMSSPGALSTADLESMVQMADGVYRQTVKAKTGICTTFGWAAAGILLREMWMKRGPVADGPKRVEVVGWRSGHVYVVLNRDGDFATVADRFKGKAPLLQPRNTWGQAYILDVWLGTLGNEYVFSAKDGTQLQHQDRQVNDVFLQGNIESLFDSRQQVWGGKSPSTGALQAATHPVTDASAATNVTEATTFPS